MIKLAISLALAALFVGYVAANKFHEHEGFEHELGHHEGHHGGFIGHRQGGYHGGLHEEEEFGHHGRFGNEGHQYRGGHGRRFGKRHFSKGRSAGGVVGVQGSKSVAAGLKQREELDAAKHHRTKAHAHRAGEGHKAVVAAKKKGFQAGVNRHDLHEREGHNRHQGFNKDKIIVKEHETGINDDVGFHDRNEHSDSAHIRGGESKFAAGKSGHRFEDDEGFENEGSSGLHRGHEREAGFQGGSNFESGEF